eukprot:TRINITY_DN3034_c0_g1_i1.p1 TRINITY_DN3034_c0_g1~~TRINITY_DN3034_c0_g1_i1.p1  ORF type:complete len:275 (-),score=57.58 TRINITY_DN3034_c0_g1_i1:461-1285(-)
MRVVVLSLVSAVIFATAQDPAEGWLGYAKAVNPNRRGIITYAAATWTNCDDPKHWGAFFSPWFGIETSDNLNLVQPVNPWSGYSWSIYNEYFQWSPTNNKNSDSTPSSAGDTIFGSVTYDRSARAYHMVHTNLNTSRTVNMTVPVQKDANGQDKTFTMAYFVFEKSWPCYMYPPSGEVVFRNIQMEYDGEPVTPRWTTAFVDDKCNNRAHIVDAHTIKITWDASAAESEKSSAGAGGGNRTADFITAWRRNARTPFLGRQMPAEPPAEVLARLA